MAAAGPGKKLCGAATKTGTCRNIAGKGTDHKGVGRCSRHGGSTASHKKAAEIEVARNACLSLGMRVETHPVEALLDELFRTQANVNFYEALVTQLVTHPTPPVRVEVVGGEEDGKVEWEHTPSVYAPTFHVSGLATGEAKPHILVTLYNDERKHLLSVLALASKMRVDEALVQTAERDARQMAEGFRGFAVACGLDPASPTVREAFRAQLTLMAGQRAA